MPAYQPIAFVRQNTNSAINASSLVVTMGAAPLAGNCLIVFSNVTVATPSTTISSISGGGMTSWTQVVAKNFATNDRWVEMWIGQNASGSGGTGITITYSATTNGLAASIMEFSGLALDTTGFKDVTGSSTFTSVTTIDTPTIATLETQSLAVACLGYQSFTATTTSGPGGSWTDGTHIATSGGTDNCTLIPCYQILSATNATLKATYVAAAAKTGCGLIATIRPITPWFKDPRQLALYRM